MTNTLKSSAFNAVADRKSTRLNSSHDDISYAVFCLKKKRAVGPPADSRDTYRERGAVQMGRRRVSALAACWLKCRSVAARVRSVTAIFFFFNDTAPPEIYTLSLHDALPIWPGPGNAPRRSRGRHPAGPGHRRSSIPRTDRKSTRLNSSHLRISYAVFCL